MCVVRSVVNVAHSGEDLEEDSGEEDSGEEDLGEEDSGEEDLEEEDSGEEEDLGEEDSGEEDSEEDLAEGLGEDSASLWSTSPLCTRRRYSDTWAKGGFSPPRAVGSARR